MAIGIRASGNVNYDKAGATNTTVSQTVTKPAASATGDLMIAAVTAFASNTGGATSVATPAGWTLIGSVQPDSTTALSAIYRIVQSGDTTWTFTVNSTGTGGIANIGVQLQTYTGTSATQPDATGTPNSNTGQGVITSGSVTIANVNSWEILVVLTGNSPASVPSWTFLASAGVNSALACVGQSSTPLSTGPTGTFSVNGGSGSGNILGCVPFSIAPTGGAPSPPPWPYIVYQPVFPSIFEE